MFETFSNAVGIQSFVSIGTVNDGNFHHVAVVRHASGTVDLYIDGLLDKSTIGTPTIMSATIKTFIGADVRDQNSLFIGVIDEVQIFPGNALSATQIANVGSVIGFGFGLDGSPAFCCATSCGMFFYYYLSISKVIKQIINTTKR